MVLVYNFKGLIYILEVLEIKKIILLMFFIFTGVSFSQDENYDKGKLIKYLERVESVEDGIAYIDVYEMEVKSGPGKGERVVIEFPHFLEDAYNIELKIGDNVVVYSEVNEDGTKTYYITDIDKRGHLIGVIIIFVLLVLVLAKLKGLKAILALFFAVLTIFYFFVPMIIKGYSPILMAILSTFVISAVTIYLIAGSERKGVAAGAGTFFGVTVAGLLSYLYVGIMRLTGYVDVEAINSAQILQNIDLKQLISAGILLGSLGAVMDVAMSVSSALYELKEHHKELNKYQLFKSGMNIGSDIIGTMVNTLILAYVGSSLFTIMLFMLQREHFPLIRILNYEFIAVEILRSLFGSIGILVAVPVTSYFAANIKIKKT